MTAFAWKTGGSQSGSLAFRLFQIAVLALTLVLAAGAAVTNQPVLAVAGMAAAFTFTSLYVLTSWRWMIAILFGVIWFIPIKRYKFPVNLPFDLEPYRVFVAFLVLVWIAALLLDPRVRLRRSGLELPMISWFLVILLSISVNYRFIESIGVTVALIKSLSFFASFIFVYFVVVSVTRTRATLELFIRILVGCGAFVAGSGVIEYRTGYNMFDHISKVFPLLRFQGALTDISRSDRLRVYASSQHPIALAAALVMMIPLAIYLAMTTRRLRWWVAAFLLGMGTLATLSRTGATMLFAGAIVLGILRPKESKRLVPFLIPAFVAVFLVLPQALGSFESAFFPKGGLVADQTSRAGVGQGYESGRLATLGPGIKQWEKRPFLGQGFGSRQVDSQNPELTNTNVLDDQWLGQLLETGAIGVAAFIWVFVRSTRLLGRIARRVGSEDGLLAGALATSIVSFGVGAATFDAFSFIQVTFLFFIVLALGASLLALRQDVLVASPDAVAPPAS